MRITWNLQKKVYKSHIRPGFINKKLSTVSRGSEWGLTDGWELVKINTDSWELARFVAIAEIYKIYW